MNNNHRIDVHQHVVPPFWAEAIPSNGGDPSGPRAGDAANSVLPIWSPDGAIAIMDSLEIATGILSLTAPGIVGWENSKRPAMARRVNEYTANLVEKHPLRFGNFATLPLPDLEQSLDELEYSLDVLKADGVILFSNYGEQYLGDDKFLPLWEALNKRKAIVFIHPGLPLAPISRMPGPLVDYPFATTRVAVQLVLNGIMDKFQEVKIILAHAGGFVPYAAHRFAELAHVFRPDAPSAQNLIKSFQRFYFDTALASSSTALPSLEALAKK